MNEEGLPTAWVTGAILAAVVLAGVTAWGLGVVARPDDAVAREARLAEQVATIEGLARARGAPASFGSQAVCARPDAAGLEAVRGDLTALAAQTNLPITTLTLAPLSPGPGDAALTPVRVSVDAEGSYEAVLNWLDRLQGRRGEVFVDSLDLTSRVATVHLKLQGKVFCWTGA